MLISAEIPFKNQEQLYKYIDFPFLINIYRDIPEYRDFYKDKCKNNISFLDNGLFESLEHNVQYDMSLGALEEGINIFQPTYVFSEEKFGDSKYTIEQAQNFKDYFKNKVKIASCCQGSTFSEYIYCYKQLCKISDCVAFSHEYKFEDEIVNINPSFKSDNKYTTKALVRMYVVSYILSNYPTNKPIHLLGCNYPIEMRYLSQNFNQIKSGDTSSPIIFGASGQKYNMSGLLPEGKIRQGKGYIYRDLELNKKNLEYIEHNINYLRGR